MKMLVLVLFSLIVLQTAFTVGIHLDHDVEELTDNLFDNLRGDPYLLREAELSESSKAFIDKQVENYMNLMLNLGNTEYSRLKRSLSENETSEGYLVDLKPYKNIPTSSPKDLILFQQQESWYAVSLEGQPQKKYSRTLTLKKLQDDSFQRIVEADIDDGVMAAVFPLKTSTFIIVAENVTWRQNFEQQTSIFRFTAEERLEVVQKINTTYSSHVSIWELENDIYMSVAQFMNRSGHGGIYELTSPIYKWCGEHFDVHQFIKSSGATRLEPFSIGDAHFLAVANSKSDSGDNKVYSHILKYDVELEKYKLFQRILTYGCRDVKHFKINLNREEEHFLIMANSQHRGLYGDASGAPSIIYKFVDNYFLPFQSVKSDGVSQWEPVTVRGDDVLLLGASPTEGLRCFQYDGWNFVESKIQFKNEVTSKGIRAMHFYKFRNKTIVVIANENDDGQSSNVIEINFSPQNQLQLLYNEMLMWCLDNERIVQTSSDVEILKKPRGDIPMEADGSSSIDDDMKKIITQLEKYKSDLDQVEEQLQNSFHSQTKHIINSDLKAQKVIVNDDGFLNSPEIDSINSVPMDTFFENVLNINDGFKINGMEFDFVRTEEPVSPTEVNGSPVSAILRTNSDFDVDTLAVHNDVSLLSDQNNVGKINNMTIDANFILLKSGNQYFDNLNINNVKFHRLVAPNVNDLEMESTQGLVQNNEKIKKLEQLRAKKIVIGGYINDVDISTLDRYALRKSGDQVITKTHYFDSIEIEDLVVDAISDKDVLNEFVPITGGRFLINKDVKFAKDIFVNNLTALNYLDSIPVKEGRLDVLERDSAESQYVTGIKSFENLELLNPIKLRGKIRSKDLDTMNPVVTIDSNLDLNGDKRITGDVIVEETIKSNDIVAGEGRNSLRRAPQQAAKLTDPEIPVRLDFFQRVDVAEVFAERINNIDPESWVVNGAKRPQIIVGRKEFLGGLEISGDTKVAKMNGVDVEELETNVLNIEGDQVISGTHYVKLVAAEKRIESDDIKIGAHPWKNVITTNTDQNITGTTTFKKNLVSNMTIAGNFKTLGRVNNVNISEIVTDAATTGTAFKIFSHKFFKNLTVADMKVKDKNIKNQITSMENHDLHLIGDVDFLNHSWSVKNIYFEDKFNGMKNEHFKITPRDDYGVQEVEGDQEFDTITTYGVVYVSSDYISDVNFTDFVDNTVKTDEPFHFESVTLNDIMVDDVILNGHVENVDLANIFENNKTEKQVFPDMKVFHGDLKVEGSSNFSGLFNKFNSSDICSFSSPDIKRKNLIIEGNASFTKGPHVYDFNGYNVNELQKRVWFTDQSAIINGNVEFGNVTFENNVEVRGLINDIDLQVLATNYLSKSKNQTISAHMTFLDGVLFNDDISTPKIQLDGQINHIKLEYFIKNVLLHEQQLFEDAVYFENLTVKELEGEYLVNNLHLDSDVMRYDKVNQVTGFKVFKDLAIDHLNDDRNITIQDINVLDWFRNSVLTEGNFQVSGKKYFQNATMEKGLSLKGTLNGRIFSENTVMLKNLAQDVDGRKAFVRTTPEGIKFKALKVKGLVNNADIAELAHNQVAKNGDNVVKSEIHFYNNITVKNIDIKGLCSGVNVTQLLKNISTLDALNNFEGSYRGLMDMANQVEKSLQGQAYFLHYFRPVTYIPNAKKIYGKTSDVGRSEIMAFHFENGSNILNFFEWNESQNLFMDTTGFNIKLGPYPSYINKIIFRGMDYIFVEDKDPSVSGEGLGYSYLGKLIHFKSNFTEFDSHSFYTKGTLFLTSFELQDVDRHCLLFIYHTYEIDIICDNPEREFYLLQSIATENSHTASVTTINGVAFLATMNKDKENRESRVTIWKLNNQSTGFDIYQVFYEEEPSSLTMISYNCGHYLAVAYGQLQKTMHLGRVEIRRFEDTTQEFIPWQSINLETPTHTEFAILPSHELVLYILSDNPAKPFNVYMYEGVSGFSKKIVGSAIPHITNMNQFSINDKHFVVAEHYNEMSIIEAVFKGEKLN